MRYIFLFSTVIGCALIAACATTPSKIRGDGDAALRNRLVALEKQSWVAWQKRDGAFFATFLSDDHVELGPQGMSGKAAIVAFVGSAVCTVRSYDVDQFSLTRISSDTALLVYHARQDTTCGKATVPSPVWASSLYVLRDGRWQNAVYQHNPAEK
jgi:Domain of unknown function (DUF4440)